jgi:fermentation-respiration switch protein FrsA (DUF1100 family)
MTRVVALLAASLAIIAVGVCVLFWAAQRRMIYYPSRDVGEPSAAGLPRAIQVSFPTDDGLTLNGWFVPAAGSATDARDAVIVFNGNAGNRSYRADLAQQFTARGFAVLLFDYRGYGDNAGTPTEEGLARDARAARRYLESRADVDSPRLVYFGESLGSAVAVRLAVEYPPRALVLRSPFTSLAEVGRYHFSYVPVSLLLRDRFPSIDHIQRIRCPLLVIAGTRDSIVPADHSRRLFERALQPKQLLLLDGADHNDEALVAGAQMVGEVVRFLNGGDGGNGEKPTGGAEKRSKS